MKLIKELLKLFLLAIPGLIIAIPCLFAGYIVTVCKGAYLLGKEIYDEA